MSKMKWEIVKKNEAKYDPNSLKSLGKFSPPLKKLFNGFNPRASRAAQMRKGGNRADKVLRRFD